MTDQDANNNSVHMRENLVQTAVKFLQNPKVVQSPLGQKKEFLKRKGLTEEEIRRACDVAGVDNYEKNIFQRNNEYASIPIHQGQIDSYYHMNLQQPTLFYKIKEFFNTTALIGATIYFIFWFYEKFIKSFLFGRKKKKDIENTVSELDKTIQESMKDVKSSILKVEGEVQKLTNNQITDPTIPQLVQELKQDLSSLKALLLSRKQFPSAPASIPSWQLDTSNSNREKTIEREDDAGSGSSANNSDSSLEMIREDPPKE